MGEETTTILVWPDNYWVYSGDTDMEELTSDKSDDFVEMEVSTRMPEENIDALVHIKMYSNLVGN